MIIDAWARAHRIPPQAIMELKALLGVYDHSPVDRDNDLESEAGVTSAVRLRAAEKNILLLRNNRGAAIDGRGRQIRFGLGNDSRQSDKVVKSSDWIGITTVGEYGVFTAYEIKHAGWKYTGTPREVAQKTFGEMVMARGGIFKFVTGPEDI